MRGTRTLTEYSSHECEQSHVQSLRDCGLSDTEIQLWLLYGDNEGVSDVIDIRCITYVMIFPSVMIELDYFLCSSGANSANYWVKV